MKNFGKTKLLPIFRGSVYISIALAVIVAGALTREGKTSSVSAPTGRWKSVEEHSEGLGIVLTVHFSKYSSDTDIKAIAKCCSPRECKAKIENFQSHGGIKVGKQFSRGGETVVIGRFFAPTFVMSRLSGKTWIITLVSGSPFLLEEVETAPGEVGLIELNVPVKGEGGTARLYMATEVVYDKGNLVPKAPASKSKLLKITSFVPSKKQIAGKEGKDVIVDKRAFSAFFDAKKDEVDIACADFEPDTQTARIYRIANVPWGYPGVDSLATVLGGAGKDHKRDAAAGTPLSYKGEPFKISNDLEIWQGAILISKGGIITVSNRTSFREG